MEHALHYFHSILSKASPTLLGEYLYNMKFIYHDKHYDIPFCRNILHRFNLHSHIDTLSDKEVISNYNHIKNNPRLFKIYRKHAILTLRFYIKHLLHLRILFINLLKQHKLSTNPKLIKHTFHPITTEYIHILDFTQLLQSRLNTLLNITPLN